MIALGLVAPLFGGAPRLITAPCAPAVAVLSGLAGDLIAGKAHLDGPVTPDKAMLLLVLVGLVCGGLQSVYGLRGAGRLIKYIPYPVVSGYLSGVGVLIIINQLPKLLGHPAGTKLGAAIMDTSHWRWEGIVVGVVTIFGVVFGPRLTRKVPAPVLGLAAGLIAYAGLAAAMPELRHLDGNKLVVGMVPSGGGGAGSSNWNWSVVRDLAWSDIRVVLVSALMLSLLLSIDTLKTCVVLDALTRSRHDSNRELLGQGLGNMASAMVGGMPGAGTMGATLVNVNSGGQTRLSGVLEGVFALVVFLLLGSAIGWLPIGALAGLLMVVAARMIDRGSFKLLRRRSTVLDFMVTLSVVLVALAGDLVLAAGVGLVLAILLFIREQMRGSVVRRKTTARAMSSKRQRTPDERDILQSKGHLVCVMELQGSLFFGTTDRLYTELESDLRTSQCIILDMRRVQSVDYTAAHLLKQMEAILAGREATLVLSNLPTHLPTGRDLEVYFGEVGLFKPTRHVVVFDTLDEALEWGEDLVLREHSPGREDNGRPMELAEFELFRELTDLDVMAAIRACIDEKSIKAGETLFIAGATGDEMYLVRKGLIRVALPMEGGRHLTLTTVPRGNFFGDMAFLDRGVRSADAVALTDAEFYVLSRERFNQLARSNPVACLILFARLARTLAMRLRQTDRELRSLMEA